MALANGSPNPGELYADVLWNTSLLPEYVRDENGNKIQKVVGASVQGLSLGTQSNPLNQTQMVTRINTVISNQIYNTVYSLSTVPPFEAISGFNCLQNVYVTNDGTYTGNNIPSRYIIMGGRLAPNTLPIQQADQLLVTGINEATYLQTDWRSPPNYDQSLPAPTPPA